MTINAVWHERHVMPRNATVEQRIAWHREHQKHCACRPIPAKLLAEIDAAPGEERPVASCPSLRSGPAVCRPVEEGTRAGREGSRARRRAGRPGRG